jgi:uncharacterized protein
VNESPRVVFDTNILFSSIGWQGNPYHCVQAARGGECLSVTCGPILLELAEKLQLKRGFDPRRTAEITEEIRAFSKVVAITGALKVVADDPDDDIVVECAVVGGAQFIVSGDRHLLALKDHGDIRIVRAADFLKLILKQRGV